MKSLLICLGVSTLAIASAPLVAKTINVPETISSSLKTKNQVTIYLANYEKDNVRAVYQPNNPRASFHYLDITKRLSNKNFTTSQITLNNISFDHRQTEIHTKNFDKLIAENEISTLGNPSYWDDQTFAENTSILYSDTIMEGVTKYNAQLSVGLIKDSSTGKIFFVWGIYGHVVLGSNQAIVSSHVKWVSIKY